MSVRDPERWQQAQALFLEAANRFAAEGDTVRRDAFLARACAGDESLRRAVERLLEADRAGASFIEEAVARGAERVHMASSGSKAGDRVGSYRLVRQIGRGGMGVVYLAERADAAFDKQVALKLIAPGLHDDERQRRFRTERQTLAGLDHPAIARLLDGGATADGRPYLVMEYVEGEPIDHHCRAHDLGLEARLRLFRTVCEAVEHAHQSLIVHRDLKPDNILVSDAGDVKLLDFGIAKLLDTDEPDPPATVGLMTPQYASPEQVRGGTITTASDVYGLGLVLYGLLSGTRPYVVAGTAPAEIARLVCEVDPPPPSVAARRAAQSASSGRAIAPARLRGDLDAIVMKALRKERGARYQSVGALIHDLDCFLAGKPVTARQGTLIYRFERLVARHRWTAAATVAALVLATGFTLRMIEERNRAEQAVALLADLIAFAEPAGLERRARTAGRQRFDARTDALVDSLAGRSGLQSRLLASVGGLYHVLGLDGEAGPLLERALELRRPLGDDAAVATSLDSLGELRRDAGAYTEAEALAREALAMRRRLFGEDDLRTAESLDNLAHILIQGGGEAAEAEALYRKALAIRRGLLGESHLLVAESANNLALVLQDLGAYDDAEAMLRRALVAYREQLGDDDPDVAMVAGNLGLLRVETGRPEDAEEHLRTALAIDRRHFGEDHGYVAQDRDNLAWALQKLGRYGEAERQYRAALAVRQRLHGDDHPDTVASVNNLATLLLDMGSYQQAVEPLRRVLSAFRQLHGDEHPHTVQASINLALALRETGNGAEAETLLRRAFDLRRRTTGPTSLATIDAQSRLGAVLMANGHMDEAEPLLRDALTAARAEASADPRHIARMLHDLGLLLMRSGRCAEAEPLLTESHRILTETLGADNRHTAETRSLLASCRDAVRPAA